MVKSKVDDISVFSAHILFIVKTHCGTICLLLRATCSICLCVLTVWLCSRISMIFFSMPSIIFLWSFKLKNRAPSEHLYTQALHWKVCKKSRDFRPWSFFSSTTAVTIWDTNHLFYRFFSRSATFYGFMYFSSQSLDGDVITVERNANLMHTILLCVFNNAMRARLLSPPPLMRCIYTIKWFERSELAIIFIYGRATASQKSPCILYIQGVLKFWLFLNHRLFNDISINCFS